MEHKVKKRRWSKNCPAANKLREDFINQKIDPTHYSSKEIHISRPEYSSWNYSRFASNLNVLARKIVKAGGVHNWMDTEKEKGKKRLSKPTFPSKNNMKTQCNVDYDPLQMYLPTIPSIYMDPCGFRRISLKILMPSGTTTDNIRAKIIDGGLSVLIERRYDDNFICPINHRNGFDLPRSDFRMVAFELSVYGLEKRKTYGEEAVWGQMKYALPFQVEENFFDEELRSGFHLYRSGETIFLGLELTSVDRIST